MAATESQIALWQAAIALAWADHELHADEKEQLHRFFEQNVQLTDAQRSTLTQMIEHKVSIDVVWGAVSDKHDRAHLINIAPVIFWQDDAFSHSEKEIYDRICKQHESTLNLTQDMEDAREMAVEFRLQWAKDAEEYAELRSRMGPIGWIMHKITK